MDLVWNLIDPSGLCAHFDLSVYIACMGKLSRVYEHRREIKVTSKVWSTSFGAEERSTKKIVIHQCKSNQGVRYWNLINH
jgi:hypothetical protein